MWGQQEYFADPTIFSHFCKTGCGGQFGAWTDNETQGMNGVPLQIRTPGVWTGERYYDPAVARALSLQTYLATQNLLGDAALANLYAADPNPLYHTLGSVLAGVAGTLVGGPGGSAVAVGAWEGLYAYALGEPVSVALEQGVIAGVTDFAFGKAFHFAAGGIGAAARKVAGGDLLERATSMLTGQAAEDANILFGQKQISPTFQNILSHAPDSIRGQSIYDVAEGLRNGSIHPDHLPIFAFRHGENLVAINNRGLAAFALAERGPSWIIIVDKPGKKILNRLGETPLIPSSIPGNKIPVTVGGKIERIIHYGRP